MSELSLSLNHASEIEAILQSWQRAWLVFGGLRGATIQRGPSLVCLTTGRQEALLNAAFQTRTSVGGQASGVDAWIDYSNSHSVPVSWHVGVGASEVSRDEQLLLRKGFALQESSMGMALRLPNWRPSNATPRELEIVEIDIDEEMDNWVSVLRYAYPMSDVLAEAISEVVRSRYAYDGEDNRHFLGRIAGVPVATLTLSIWNTVGSVYDVATSSAHRRRGIAQAMTTAACVVAQQHGCHMMVLHSTNAGKSVYERVGFSGRCVLRQYEYPSESLTGSTRPTL